MADNEVGEVNAARGNDWEVVSLTASAYAAAPGPREVKDEKQGDKYWVDEAETSSALFMSRHFVFPPSEHENLPLKPLEPLKPDSSEIVGEQAGEEPVFESIEEEGGRSGGKDEEVWTLKGLNVADDFPGMSLNEKEQSLYKASTFGSLHSEEAFAGSTMFGENVVFSELDGSEQGLGFPADAPQSPTLAEDDKFDGSSLPCEAWWKRRAISLYSHAKEANTFWSIFIAAAVMGIVILGQRWQQERWQAMQLKWQHTVNNEVS